MLVVELFQTGFKATAVPFTAALFVDQTLPPLIQLALPGIALFAPDTPTLIKASVLNGGPEPESGTE